MMDEVKKEKDEQFCPACKRGVVVSSRYPNYVCRDCVLLATDEEGKALEFFNSDIFGHGCVGSYKDSEEVYGSNICYIKGIKFEANEAYMGGIVVTPVLSLQ
ncbi:hypothetical protein HDE68_002150 [Pedobacter cryoconitis]|uniref:Uncharacterized protein n=1 Tax=Pedobacter cryoconitis TaxID=188932 RepID=A0A7W9DYI2_9SPHI|nr:hypothetical protein [Pedobacter cryoconitis]MBB5636262.1 hypothetical protein [Pedobacter cryoconitis]